MTLLIKLASILLVSLQLAGTSHAESASEQETTPLSAYSTEEIIAEYHARFDAINTDKLQHFVDSLPYETGITILSQEEAAPYRAELEDIYAALKPFVDAGYKPAMLTTAFIHLVYGFTELFDGHSCEGLKLAREVALSGGADGASAAGILVNYFKVWNPREDTEKSAMFWSIWFQQLDPELEASSFTKVPLERAPPELLIEWAKWSPKTDPGLEAEIERVCVN